MNLLDIKNLKTTFEIDSGKVQAVRGISLSVAKGESCGIVGESGSGKSVSMLSVMRLLPENAKLEAESISFDGVELTQKSNKYMRRIRGDKISMIFQDSMTSLNPLLTIGDQLMEPLKIHQKMSKAQAWRRAVEMLSMVEIASPESRMRQYPYELSGGMRQRVMIAMALSCNPKLLIADEPTTALDVTIQAQILQLMRELKRNLNTSIVMITHDLGVVANMCSRIFIMYGGLIVERGTTDEIFHKPLHPYTRGLLNCVPSIDVYNKKKLVPILGSPPDLIKPPRGCPFTDRCDNAMRICKQYMPDEYMFSDTHTVSCHLLHPMAGKTDWKVAR